MTESRKPKRAFCRGKTVNAGVSSGSGDVAIIKIITMRALVQTLAIIKIIATREITGQIHRKDENFHQIYFTKSDRICQHIFFAERVPKSYRKLRERGFTLDEKRINLRRLREQRGWTQTQAAAKLGFARAYVSRVETGKSGISLNMMHALIRVFHLKYADFYDDEAAGG